METAPLKSFATWARTALIQEVSARISVVLASPELRQEQPKAVAALEKAVNAAGGGDGGRDALAEKVAYTWFNRIIALRFMDANGYTGIGVISPERGREGSQPEILAEANRGNIDPEIVRPATATTVTSLLNGTRRSPDPLGEAYALLLAEYCRNWNRSMPFMFEREGDYTELLIPANLLADDSVLARAATVLTEEVCQDVEVIGWLYQFYISERKDEVFAGFKKNKKAGAAEIPAATQLFTPHWIVRYLVENSLGRLWLLNRPTSRLANEMDYYVAPVDEEKNFLKVSSPTELKVIDPACGSGHMLTYAFDLLYAIYEEEGYAPSEIPGLILTNNLYGTEIDPRAGALAAFALTMKARDRQRTFFNKQVQPNICVLEPISFTKNEMDTLIPLDRTRSEEEQFWNQFEHADTYGALIQPRQEMIDRMGANLIPAQSQDQGLFTHDIVNRAHRVVMQARFLSQRYSIVVANPPYMGGKNMSPKLSSWMEENYPDSKSDLMTGFMERVSRLVVPNGLWAMINLPSWLFLPSFQRLRQSLIRTSTIASLLHLGRGVFGADFGSVAFVVSNNVPGDHHRGVYRRLFEKHVDVRLNGEIELLFLDSQYNRFETEQSTFVSLPGNPIAYWLSSRFREVFETFPALSEVAAPKQGLATADDGKYLRYWYEVARDRIGFGCESREAARQSGRKWFPFNKGGAFRRWYGNIVHVINWEDDGRELFDLRPKSVIRSPHYYFEPSVSWSNVSSGAPAFRDVPPGVIFGHVGQSLFADENTRISLLAILNSSFGARALEILAPTIHFNVGEVAKVPISLDLDSRIDSIVCSLIDLSKLDWNSQEISFDFEGLSWINGTSGPIADRLESEFNRWQSITSQMQTLEAECNSIVANSFRLGTELAVEVPRARVSLVNNPEFRFGVTSPEVGSKCTREASIIDLISYAVGCMFGRYSLDERGLILANQGDTLQDYFNMVSNASFVPDGDNVIPIVDGDWFEDDIVARFRQFLRIAFGEDQFEDNLRYVTEALGVKNLRDYFVKSFYKDHVQRYKKRPIYWLFSSPKGSFNALIYMHRYTPSTASTVLNEYLREFKAKLEASRQHHEHLAAGIGTPREKSAAQKEVDRLRKVLLELDEYEHDVLYPLATQQVQIELDDGVKANYPKLGAALKKIPGLEASNE